ncbi:MAG: cysteine-rich CWC family protein [Planctomycetaceae bacterium]|nr:cysteine-rich CWC family protein [Planctomycetaceae bacterium]
MINKVCPGCGAGLVCGLAPGKEHCWCADLPRIMPLPDPAAGCYCPDCLAREIRRRQGAGSNPDLPT